MIRKYISFTAEFGDEWETIISDAAFATKYFGEEIERNEYARELLAGDESFSLRILLLYLLTSGIIHRNDLDEALGAMRVAFSKINPRKTNMPGLHGGKLPARHNEDQKASEQIWFYLFRT